MRVGQNPAKSIDHVAQAQSITVAMVTYIPFLRGYYTHALDVLKLSLESLWQNSDRPYDLLVFDNASCPEVCAYLEHARQDGRIQYLVLSEKNVGKGGAWNFLFGAAPGDLIVYADGDVYFHSGWLSALLQVFDTFPNAGMVTGMPLLNPLEFSASTLSWAQQNPEVTLERGKLLPWEDYWRHAGTLGSDMTEARAFYEQNESVLIHHKGEKFFVGAGHFQFLARKEVLQHVVPIPSDRPMGQVRNLDIAIDRMGYLRLCTTQWWVEHLGNTPPEKAQFSDVFKQGSLDVDGKLTASLWQRKNIRNLLLRLHNKTFELLYRR